MIGCLEIHVYTCIECKTVMFVHTNQISLCENFDNSFLGRRVFAQRVICLRQMSVCFRTEGTESSEDFNSIGENPLLSCVNPRPSISHSAFGLRPSAFEVLSHRGHGEQGGVEESDKICVNLLFIPPNPRPIISQNKNSCHSCRFEKSVLLIRLFKIMFLPQSIEVNSLGLSSA